MAHPVPTMQGLSTASPDTATHRMYLIIIKEFAVSLMRSYGIADSLG